VRRQEPMKRQWIPFAGLAATIALCGYMVVQLALG
jgi:hypothetical protein